MIDNNIITEISRAIINERIADGHILITIIFHNNRWTDIFVKILAGEKPGSKVEIGKTGFLDILRDCKDFPQHGQIEFEFFVRGKEIVNPKVMRTNRIHNNRSKKCKKEY